MVFEWSISIDRFMLTQKNVFFLNWSRLVHQIIISLIPIVYMYSCLLSYPQIVTLLGSNIKNVIQKTFDIKNNKCK